MGEKWLEEVMHGLPVDEAGWKQKFFRVWRLWQERCAREKNPLLAYLAADTRIPDHTLWHHNALVSALEGAGTKASFLYFQIGPVQDFIAQARRMLDLWSASYLLSFLISKALATVALRFGPDAIIYPNLRGVPLLDLWWSKEADLFPEGFFLPGEGRLHPDEALTPSLPNRFLALVPAGEEGQDIARKARDAVRDLWLEIADAVHADICTRLQQQFSRDAFPHWDAHWRDQVCRFPVVDWVLHEWQAESQAFNNAENGTPPLTGGWKAQALRHAAAWRDMIPQQHRESWHGKANDAFAWPLHYAASDWKFAARKNARGFAAWPDLALGAKSPPKDHLNGRDEVLGGASPSAFWQALRSAYGGAEKGDFKGSQLYGATSVIKRLWPAVFLRGKLQWSEWKPRFESVQDIARAIDSEPDKTLPAEDPKYYAVLCMDGDDMGQWVSGAKTPTLKSVLAAKAWEYFKQGKDGHGGWRPSEEQVVNGLPPQAEDVRRPLSPGFHAALSDAISNFGLYCAGQIVEAFKGQLLYSGGDDVLAMLPTANVLGCALALQCAFRGQMPPALPFVIRRKLEALFEFYPDSPGFIRCRNSGKDESLRPNWPLIVPGPRATASAGIAIGHVHAPMQDTIQAAREAELVAKSVPDKGAFCLRVLKRSGESAQFAAKWESGVPAIWTELTSDVLDQTRRFAYRYLQLIRPLLVTTAADQDRGWEKRWTLDLKCSAEAELRHVLHQQASQETAKATINAHRWIGSLIGDDLDQPALTPRDFVHFWMAWAFVNRLKGELDHDD